MPLFPAVAAATLFIGGIGSGAALRRSVGRHWTVLLTLACLTLIPWLFHHHEVVHFTAEALDQQGVEGAFERVRWVEGTGLAAVSAATATILLAARWFPLMAAAIPGTAFLVTWYLTFPLALAAIPDGYIPLDNVATIWLAIMSVGGTGLLLGYCLRFRDTADKWRPAV